MANQRSVQFMINRKLLWDHQGTLSPQENFLGKSTGRHSGCTGTNLLCWTDQYGGLA